MIQKLFVGVPVIAAAATVLAGTLGGLLLLAYLRGAYLRGQGTGSSKA